MSAYSGSDLDTRDNRPYSLVHKITKTTINGVTTVEKVTEKVFLDGSKERLENTQEDLDDFADLERKFKRMNPGQKTNMSVNNTLEFRPDDDHKGHEAETTSSSDDETQDTEFSKFVLRSLDEHNKYRDIHGVPPLKLNKQMCEFAQEWAELLIRENKFQHRGKNKYGENLYTSWSSRPIKPVPRDAVKSWYSEIDKYTFGREPRSSSTGHFTQLVWKTSRDLGVGLAAKDGRTIVVANYYPPGNYMGEYVENVPAPLNQYASIENARSYDEKTRR